MVLAEGLGPSRSSRPGFRSGAGFLAESRIVRASPREVLPDVALPAVARHVRVLHEQNKKGRRHFMPSAFFMVLAEGLEPPRLAPLVPKTSVSTIPPCERATDLS
jgi:hypothetical protein